VWLSTLSETYQLSENSTYPELIETLSPSSKVPFCKVPPHPTLVQSHPRFDIRIISAILEGPVITISSGKLVRIDLNTMPLDFSCGAPEREARV
jgi:hypothetical protein